MQSFDPVDAAARLSEAGIAGFGQRIARLAHAGDDWQAMQSSLAAAGWSVGGVVLSALAFAALAAAAHAGAERGLGAWMPALARRPVIRRALALLVAFVASAIVAHLALPPSPVRRALVGFGLAPSAILLSAAAMRLLVAPGEAGHRGAPLRQFAARLALAIGWMIAGSAAVGLLRASGAGPGLRDVVATAFVALPVTILFARAYWLGRRPLGRHLAMAIGSKGPLRRFMAAWPGIAIGLIAGGFVASQLIVTFGGSLGGGIAVLTLTLVLLAPHIDALIARWARAGLDGGRVAVPLVAFRRTLRLAALTVIGGALLVVWSAPVAALTGFAPSRTFGSILAIVAVILASAFLWNLIGVAVDRIMRREGQAAGAGEEGEHVPRSRLGTLLPLTAGAGRIAILALTGLTILLAFGVNVWPLITGLSVFGLAIGFGSQTLVKDIVSGLFFLADDAFRIGEYVETSGAKGTVERISIRSLALRHPRGAIATIPYGQIGKIVNHSRDYVIEKLVFRVAFDTDIEKVRKLFKKIGQDIAADEALSEGLLEPFKSQGIAALEDGTLVIRGKFKAKAGKQFAIRKAVLSAVQRTFNENGIKAVARPFSPAPAA